MLRLIINQKIILFVIYFLGNSFLSKNIENRILQETTFPYLHNNTDTILAENFGVLLGESLPYNQSLFQIFELIKKKGKTVLKFSKGKYFIDTKDLKSGQSELIFRVPGNIIVLAEDAEFISNGPYSFKFESDSAEWSGGKITNGRFNISASEILLKNITVENSWSISFHIDGGFAKKSDSQQIKKVYRNIRIQNCNSFRSSRMGFAISRADYPFKANTDAQLVGIFENIEYTNCQVIEPSYIPVKADKIKKYFSRYDYGFGVENVLQVRNVEWKDCYARFSPGCGWHFESSTNYVNIRLKNCVTDSCGQEKSGYPFAFMYQSGIQFNNCKAMGNHQSAFNHNASFKGNNYSFINCSEAAYRKFNYDPVKDSDDFVLNPKANSGIACTGIYLKGSSLLPMNGNRNDLFGIDSVRDGGKWKTIVFNKMNKVTDESIETSLASQPLRINKKASYGLEVEAFLIRGNTSNLKIYLQEYDASFRLIKIKGKNYSLKHHLSNLSQKKSFTQTIKIFGSSNNENNTHSELISLKMHENTRWLRATLVFCDRENETEKYGISRFEIRRKR